MYFPNAYITFPKITYTYFLQALFANHKGPRNWNMFGHVPATLKQHANKFTKRQAYIGVGQHLCLTCCQAAMNEFALSTENSRVRTTETLLRAHTQSDLLLQKTFENLWLFKVFWYSAWQPRSLPNHRKSIPKASKIEPRSPSWLHLAASWAPSWRSWAPSWLILGLLGAILAHLRALGRHLAAKDVAT